jgi:hypothetical protein
MPEELCDVLNTNDEILDFAVPHRPRFELKQGSENLESVLGSTQDSSLSTAPGGGRGQGDGSSSSVEMLLAQVLNNVTTSSGTSQKTLAAAKVERSMKFAQLMFGAMTTELSDVTYGDISCSTARTFASSRIPKDIAEHAPVGVSVDNIHHLLMWNATLTRPIRLKQKLESLHISSFNIHDKSSGEAPAKSASQLATALEVLLRSLRSALPRAEGNVNIFAARVLIPMMDSLRSTDASHISNLDPAFLEERISNVFVEILAATLRTTTTSNNWESVFAEVMAIHFNIAMWHGMHNTELLRYLQKDRTTSSKGDIGNKGYQGSKTVTKDATKQGPKSKKQKRGGRGDDSDDEDINPAPKATAKLGTKPPQRGNTDSICLHNLRFLCKKGRDCDFGETKCRFKHLTVLPTIPEQKEKLIAKIQYIRDKDELKELTRVINN